MLPAVHDVHHRCWQQVGANPPQVSVEWLLSRDSRCLRHGQRRSKNGVRTKLALVRCAIEFDHGSINFYLIESVSSDEFFDNMRVHIVYGFGDPLTKIRAGVAIAELIGLMGSSTGPTWNGGPTKGTICQFNVDFNRRVASAIENLATVNVDNRAHFVLFPSLQICNSVR